MGASVSQVDPANADSEEGGYLENCLLPEFFRVKDTGVSCTGLLSPPNRDDLEGGQCVVQKHAWKAEGAMDGPGWSWCWNGRLKKKSPFISQGMGSSGQFSQAHRGLEGAAGSLGEGVRSKEEEYGDPWVDSVNL